MSDLTQQTWDELGHTIRPMGDTCFVRTDPIPVMTPGGIILTDKTRMFYNGLPNPGGNSPVVKWATVIAAGPDATDIHEGDRVCFMRLDFAWSDKMQDGTLFGWIRGRNIHLKSDGNDL